MTDRWRALRARDSQSIIEAVYIILFGAATAGLEFHIPAPVQRYASFMFSFIGRGVCTCCILLFPHPTGPERRSYARDLAPPSAASNGRGVSRLQARCDDHRVSKQPPPPVAWLGAASRRPLVPSRSKARMTDVGAGSPFSLRLHRQHHAGPALDPGSGGCGGGRRRPGLRGARVPAADRTAGQHARGRRGLGRGAGLSARGGRARCGGGGKYRGTARWAKGEGGGNKGGRVVRPRICVAMS